MDKEKNKIMQGTTKEMQEKFELLAHGPICSAYCNHLKNSKHSAIYFVYFSSCKPSQLETPS